MLPLLLVVTLATGCGNGSGQAVLRAECLPAEGRKAVVEGEGPVGRWRLFATPSWEDRAYGLELRSEAHLEAGCGSVGPDDALLGITGGGTEVDGRHIRYVYGAVLPPVATVRVAYESGSVVELQPVRVAGFDHRFFVHVAAAPSGFSAEALDGQGRVLDRS